jgi:hypothetical protein
VRAQDNSTAATTRQHDTGSSVDSDVPQPTVLHLTYRAPVHYRIRIKVPHGHSMYETNSYGQTYSIDQQVVPHRLPTQIPYPYIRC